MSASKVMTIEEMIKLTFRDKDTNVVNFNLFRTLLHLFARQLQVLERKVAVKLDTPYYGDFIVSSIKITEVKIHASTSYQLNAKQEKLKTKLPPPKKRSPLKESGRLKASNKNSLRSKGQKTKSSSQLTARALKFSEDVYSKPPSGNDSMFLYQSPRFSDNKHFTSKSSVADSTATPILKLCDVLVDTEKDVPLKIEQLTVKEPKSENLAYDKNLEKITRRKESKAKSLDTFLYKVNTQTSLANKRFSAATAEKSIRVPKPQAPKIIIKHMPHTDADDNVTTKKIIILRKIRKRIKYKPEKLDNIDLILSDDSSEIKYDKYRLSTEPYLGEDFVPIDITKAISEENEKDFRKNKLEADDILRHGHIRFSIENEIHSNEDNVIEGTIADKTREEVERESMKSISKDIARLGKGPKASDDENKQGKSTQYSSKDSDQVEGRYADQQHLDQKTILSQDENQLGEDRVLESNMIRKGIESDQDTLDKRRGSTGNYDDQDLDHKVLREDLDKGILGKGTKKSSKDQLAKGKDIDDNQYKLSQSSQYPSTDFDQDMLGKKMKNVDGGSDKEKKYTGIYDDQGILGKSIKSTDIDDDKEITGKAKKTTHKDKGKKITVEDGNFDRDMEEKYRKGIEKDDDETESAKGERRSSKDTGQLSQGSDYDDDQYKLDKWKIATDKDSDQGDFGKDARPLSKDVDKDTLAKDSRISRIVSDQDRLSKIREESLKHIKTDPNTVKYRVKVGRTPDTLRERILIVEKTPSELASGRMSRFPFVTQEEFARLKDEFQDLQRILYESMHKNWHDQKLMELLSKGTTTIDPIAALQLSASLESTENKIEALSNILVSFARQFPGSIDENELTELLKSVSLLKQLRSPDSTAGAADRVKGADKDEIKYGYGRVGAAGKKIVKSTAAIGGLPIRIEDEMEETSSLAADFGSQFPIGGLRTPHRSVLAKQRRGDEQGLDANPNDLITFEQLESAADDLTVTILKQFVNNKKRITDQVDSIMKDFKDYEGALTSVSNVMGPLEDVNALIANFAKAVNKIERNLTTTMSSNMEDLMQMQYNLENHVESMMEALVNVQGDPEAIADFSKLLNLFAEKRMAMKNKQVETESEQKQFAFSLERLRLLVLALKSDKYERSNFAVLLQNLVNMCDLNKLIPHDTFEATWNDIDRKIVTAFSTFDVAEINWQERITDLVQQLNGKADSSDISLLFNNIEIHCNNLLSKLRELSAIVLHDLSEAGSKYIIRDANCLSCRTEPVDLDKVVTRDRGEGEPSKLSAPYTTREKALHSRGLSHVRPCYPGEPISHALDPRAKFCPHYCGGDAKQEDLFKVPVVSGQPKCACGEKMDKLKKPCLKCHSKRSCRFK